MDKKIVKKLIKLTKKKKIRWRVTQPNGYTNVYSTLFHYIPIHLSEVVMLYGPIRYTILVAGVLLNVKRKHLVKLKCLASRKYPAWQVHSADREESLPKWVADNFK